MASRRIADMLFARPQLAYPVFCIVGWCVLLGATLYFRAMVPIDETRYVGVAWEMWLRHDFLVPFKNGMAYSHKPPLLFWMIHAGWLVFGVNEWWPRIMPALFSLGSLLLTARLATRIWPDVPLVGRLAPAITLGCLVWAVFAPTLMFDMILTFWVLLGINGVWLASTGERRGWWMLIAGIGFGILSKGPVALLHILPAAILSPLWSTQFRQHGARWYGMLSLSVIAGAAIVLAWAIPAGVVGGEVYRNAIFWGQTAGRVSHSFTHMRDWWWYLPTLPLLLFPWSIWWPAWSGLKEAFKVDAIEGTRFLLSWMIPVFITFSVVSGKQVHYLLPLCPAVAMLVAVGLSRRQHLTVTSMIPVCLALLLWAVLLAMIPGLQEKLGLPAWAGEISPLASVLLAVAAVLLLLLARRQSLKLHVLMLASTSLLAVVLMLAIVGELAARHFDVEEPSRVVAALQDNNIPVAHIGVYHDQFQFSGRLTKALPELTVEQTSAWAAEHPDGYIVTYPKSRSEALDRKAEYVFPYLDHWLAIIRAADWPQAPGPGPS